MAIAKEINPAVGGANGKRVVLGSGTMSSGQLDITNPLEKVEYAFVSLNDATSSESLCYELLASGTVSVLSTSAGSVKDVTAILIGY